MEEDKTIEELNQHITDVLEDVEQMTKDFASLDTFSHYNQFLGALTPTGILGAIRENVEQNRLKKYLETKIYRDMTFREIGYKLVDITQDLVETQNEIKKRATTTEEGHPENIAKIFRTLMDCRKAWVAISPKVAEETLTLTNGDEIQLGPRIEVLMWDEFAKMDASNLDSATVAMIQKESGMGGMGCMVIIAIALANLLASFFLFVVL